MEHFDVNNENTSSLSALMYNRKNKNYAFNDFWSIKFSYRKGKL